MENSEESSPYIDDIHAVTPYFDFYHENIPQVT